MQAYAAGAACAVRVVPEAQKQTRECFEGETAVRNARLQKALALSPSVALRRERRLVGKGKRCRETV